MFRYVANRLLLAIPTLIGVAIITFFVLRVLPGDIVEAKLRGDGAQVTVDVIERELLGPILGITDVRTDKRIDFVGGIRGPAELERLVDAGGFAVAFSMYPVSTTDLMRIADAGGIMPPKSTWFEPKLRDGLLSHVIA